MRGGGPGPKRRTSNPRNRRYKNLFEVLGCWHRKKRGIVGGIRPGGTARIIRGSGDRRPILFHAQDALIGNFPPKGLHSAAKNIMLFQENRAAGIRDHAGRGGESHIARAVVHFYTLSQ